MSGYFREIIFPPHQIKTSKKFDYVFWFEKELGYARLSLMAQCKKCSTIYLFLASLNGVYARKVLNENIDEYVKYSQSHCPHCYPNNSVKLSDSLIFLLRRL